MAPKRKTQEERRAAREARKLKRARNDPLASKIIAVQSALRDRNYVVPGVPEAVREMLASCAKHALSGDVSERHKSQVATTKMIGELLVDIRKESSRGPRY